MNTNNGSKLEANLSKSGICLTIQNQGCPPSFKNSKTLFRNKKTKKLFIATNPKNKKWMESAIRSLESQLKSFIQTREGVIWTELAPACLIALLNPLTMFDDSLQHIPEINIRCRKVDKGLEGAIIILEEIK
jgi:hypothetical protein